MKRSRDGNGDAFGVLVRRHLPGVRAVALSVCGDPDQADDLCQDAFLAALKRLDQLKDPDRFRGWMLQIARNLSLNHRGREKRRLLLSAEALEKVAGPGDPHQELLEREAEEHLSAAAALLSGLPKRVFILHEVEGLDHSRIAEELDISRGASRVHLFFARRILRARTDRSLLEGV